jgi:hypothetical protein
MGKMLAKGRFKVLETFNADPVFAGRDRSYPSLSERHGTGSVA